ncbi:MAG: FGGY-family carbohydrate kinase [Fimbriimonadaceae bacterium]|nr:FGGY-family carbohydrate kinase [Fimbriimonadaceae bacterium]
MKQPTGAVAVDLGATSARFAAGFVHEGELRFEMIRQVPHAPREDRGRLVWDLDALVALTREAIDYAEAHFERSTVGVDAWGVDHGFIDPNGELIQSPVCYRDPSHERAFERFSAHRDDLYALTGIQHQPFNTIYQLAARAAEDPTLPHRARYTLLLPDLIGYLLTREPHAELTEASTTQLLGLDDQWSPEAFALIDWPVFDLEPMRPGLLGSYVARGVRWCTVASHDTASAVLGLEPLDDATLFLNLGTWSLAGVVIDRPLVSDAARIANLTNERCADGRVRLLKNVPGFWVINRLHAELGVPTDVPTWIARASELAVPKARLNLDHPDLFSPESMLAACRAQLSHDPTPAEWAAIALHSLVDALAELPQTFADVLGRPITRIRVGGGGSRSEALRNALAHATGRPISVGPAEATVVGNLTLQLTTQAREWNRPGIVRLTR